MTAGKDGVCRAGRTSAGSGPTAVTRRPSPSAGPTAPTAGIGQVGTTRTRARAGGVVSRRSASRPNGTATRGIGRLTGPGTTTPGSPGVTRAAKDKTAVFGASGRPTSSRGVCRRPFSQKSSTKSKEGEKQQGWSLF